MEYTSTMSESFCSMTVLFLKKRRCWAKAVSGLLLVGPLAKTSHMLDHSEDFLESLVQKVFSF